MIVKSLYLLFLLTFLVLPFFYHRKKSKPSMTKFYLRMAFSHNFRKCYRLVLLSTLLMFHFYHLSLFKLPLELGFQNGYSAFCSRNGHFSEWRYSLLSACLLLISCRLALPLAH